MKKTYALCFTIVLAALVVIVGPDARKAFYQHKCESTMGGVSLWLANGPDDQRHDGLTKPYCRIDGINQAM